jgi:cellobiose phosphorylase
MRAEINANGSVRRFDCDAISLTLFVGNELEGGATNLYLRRHASQIEWTPLLGPLSGTTFEIRPETGVLSGTGTWQGINYWISLVLSQKATAWFWHIRLENTTAAPQLLDLTYAQDLALAPYGAVRNNEFYVSQYIDHTPLSHDDRGTVVASRQNQAADGRNPWSLIGSLRKGASFATDALQFHGLATRDGDAPIGLLGDLPGKRLQHEHSMVVIRDTPIQLEPKKTAAAGFFGVYQAHHPDATAKSDLGRITEILALPEAKPQAGAKQSGDASNVATLFSSAPILDALDLDSDSLQALFGSQRRQEELDEHGKPLSFFYNTDRHVVLRSKELKVQRPHGHLLRTGRHITPDESALTSTVWMSGVFHSMVTQGHVNINRMLSTVHSYLGLFRSHGQRVFMQVGGEWRLLNVPSAFEMSPDSCRWIYRHEGGVVEVRSEARHDPQELTLTIEVTSGQPTQFLICHHMALNGDDGSAPGAARWSQQGDHIAVTAPEGTDVGRRFPKGSFAIAPLGNTKFQRAGGDELLFVDGRSRQQPFLCVVTQPALSAGLSISGHLIEQQSQTPLRVKPGDDLIPTLTIDAPATSPLAKHAARLADIAPWYTQNALVHYLSPRGLEQYSGGGWGTRDVCQGPVELLLALDRTEPIRNLLLIVMGMQNADGDWPQWFMFFDRERDIRAGDAHGDVIFWPLVVLAQYLTASGDAGLLDERIPFFDSRGSGAGEPVTVSQHVQRALAIIEKRVIPGTALAAYGHGDWNDSLQPADPTMRDHMCSAWTVTLNFQMLTTLAHALRGLGRADEADRLEKRAEVVRRDFQRLLIVDDVLAGYGVFDENGHVRHHLLHPSDPTTGVHYSSLAMIHAILEDVLTPAQAREHLRLIDAHLSAPDGVRLFDRPMPYHGGPQQIFQRAETATYFGREIGLMYTHAHLRFAQALAHIGEAERFFHALCQANPIGISSLLPTATLRQANCYYSSSDAAFADRYQASAEYERVRNGTIAFDGGWRVYSSGAGISLSLIVRRFLGLNWEHERLSLDPVIPAALDGMKVRTTMLRSEFEIRYRIGKAGCGVNKVSLNQRPLSFTSGPNPHRRGAALIVKAALLEAVAAGVNILEVDIG